MICTRGDTLFEMKSMTTHIQHNMYRVFYALSETFLRLLMRYCAFAEMLWRALYLRELLLMGLHLTSLCGV